MKYIFEEIKPKNGVMRDVHMDVLNRPCKPEILEVGERGYIRFMPDYDDHTHHLHTSTIRNIVYSEDGRITIETRNTIYILKRA